MRAQIIVTLVTFALIYTLGFGAVLVLILAVLGLYVVVALFVPVQVRLKMRIEEKPVVHTIAWEDPAIAADVRTRLDADREALTALGFEWRDLIHQAAGPASAGAYLALYRHPTTRARALSRVVMKSAKGQPAVHSNDVELEMTYDDDTHVELSNVPGAVPGLELIPGLIRQMPQVRDVPRLHDYFMRLVARFETDTGRSTSARVALPDDATMTTVYHSQLQTSAAVRQRAGLQEPSRTPGVGRPTWRMAFRIAAAGISPGTEFITRRIRTRAERLQRELDGDSTLTSHERIGRRTGWTMFGIGLTLALAAFASAPTMCTVAIAGMSIAWWIAGRGGRTPGWRAILVGGLAGMLIEGLLVGLAYSAPAFDPSIGFVTPPMSRGFFILPMATHIAGTILVVEGFRAAAT